LKELPNRYAMITAHCKCKPSVILYASRRAC
jgi:hypothetical protein